jgi:KaiC/GvpD/RAD55 family RecA-like ATPase
MRSSQRGERCLYILFEESPNQLMRNMSTVGIALSKSLESGLLQFQTLRTFITAWKCTWRVSLSSSPSFRRWW